MDRIKTKFIIAVTNQLSAAADTNAKTDLIEELSENLYQRYLELIAQGAEEDAAYQSALDDLGDVDELLAYLGSLGPDEELPPSEGSESRAKAVADDVLRGLEDFLRETVSQTEEAVHQAKAMLRGAVDKMKEKYPDGFKGKVSIRVDDDSEASARGGEAAEDGESAGKGWSFTAGYNKERGGFFCGNHQSRRVAGPAVPSGELKAIDVGLVNGDVDIRFSDDPDADVVLSGDTEALELRLSDDGRLLTVRQGNTASSSFFFGRGLASADVELTIPRRQWELIRVETANGDVKAAEGLEAAQMKVKTANGDLDVDGARCGLLTFKSASGELDCRDFTGDVQASTASGDIELTGAFGRVEAGSASGDVEVRGCAREVICNSISGDVALSTSFTPERLDLSSKSGDIEAAMPGGVGFTLRFSTVSGKLETAFPLVGPTDAKSGEAIYLDGGQRAFHISTVSGDITIQEY